MKSNLLKIAEEDDRSSQGLKGWGEREAKGGKVFHTEETAFRRTDLTETCDVAKGRENFSATRL